MLMKYVISKLFPTLAEELYKKVPIVLCTLDFLTKNSLYCEMNKKFLDFELMIS